MNFFYKLSAILISAAIVVGQFKSAVALTDGEVVSIGKEITVLITGKDITIQITGEVLKGEIRGYKSTGSGIIFQRQGNYYYVLTNRHVVDEYGSYEIHTPDGESHKLEKLELSPDLDLAVLQFKSNKTYRIAELGNSSNLTETTRVFVVGWAEAGFVPKSNEPTYHITDGKVTTIVQKPVNDGYALVYTNLTVSGTSGAPILDENGQVVGINGQMTRDPKTGRDFSYGIPINFFLEGRNNLVAARIQQLPEKSLPTLGAEELENLGGIATGGGGEIIESSGQVLLKRGGASEYRSTGAGEELQPGDLIFPQPGAKVTILCPNLTIWRVPVGIPSIIRCPAWGDVRTVR